MALNCPRFLVFLLRQKVTLFLFPPLRHLPFFQMTLHNAHNFRSILDHGIRSWPRTSLFFTADVISSHYGSLQSNSDFGTWTSTFLMHGPRSLFRSGSEWVSLRYCSTSPFVHLKEPGLSLPSRYFVNLNGSFRKRAQSFVLPFFIFLILSVRPNLDNSDLTSSVNTAIPIFSSMKHLWTVCWGCLSCLWHSLILIFFLLSP